MSAKPDLSWLDELTDMQILRVPGVPGVPASNVNDLAGTRDDEGGVPCVPQGGSGTRGTPKAVRGVPHKSLQSLQEHVEHKEHGKVGGADAQSWGLEPALTAALIALSAVPPPARIKDRGVWREIVDDALGLARDGWAATAMALGWSAYDLFGTGPDDSNQYDGLAVWLAGRAVAMLDENKVRTTCGATFFREDFMRPASPRVTPVYLWQLGRRA